MPPMRTPPLRPVEQGVDDLADGGKQAVLDRARRAPDRPGLEDLAPQVNQRGAVVRIAQVDADYVTVIAAKAQKPWLGS